MSNDRPGESPFESSYSELLERVQQASFTSELLLIESQAVSQRKLARGSKCSLSTQNTFGEVELRAKRRLGQLIGHETQRGGDRRSEQYKSNATLQKHGITSNFARRCRAIARVPERKFEAYFSWASESSESVSQAGLFRYLYLEVQGIMAESNPTLSIDHQHRHANDDNLPTSDIASVIRDLRGHVHLISNIVNLVGRGESDKLGTVEVRCLAHYVNELEDTVTELANTINVEEELE